MQHVLIIFKVLPLRVAERPRLNPKLLLRIEKEEITGLDPGSE